MPKLCTVCVLDRPICEGCLIQGFFIFNYYGQFIHKVPKCHQWQWSHLHFWLSNAYKYTNKLHTLWRVPVPGWHCLMSRSIPGSSINFLDQCLIPRSLFYIVSLTATDFEKSSSWFHFRYFVRHAIVWSINGPRVFICHNNQGYRVLCLSCVFNPIPEAWLGCQDSDWLCCHVVSSPTHWNICLP